jgi:hypothetical protein
MEVRVADRRTCGGSVCARPPLTPRTDSSARFFGRCEYNAADDNLSIFYWWLVGDGPHSTGDVLFARPHTGLHRSLAGSVIRRPKRSRARVVRACPFGHGLAHIQLGGLIEFAKSTRV